ncbi:histone H3.v1 [Apis florea]|uniref:histone H3.v1 n=1 Tax=Apis florea TaxID=7463 RepID=UPI0012FEC558|nr:histone H3.v1 [Apis florea]
MGQAWCKEKTSKAQDSKSPLDRVFVRCAHRIYPSLKEEGSMLGGGTQRVTRWVNEWGSNLRDATPIPPPRRRKRNKGRPLPPKPDEVSAENPSNREEAGNEPLYSSVRSPKSSGDEQEAEEKTRPTYESDGKRSVKEIYQHKVNGTGRIISSDVVSGRRWCRESDEYERFANSRTSRDSSTPKREEKRKWRQGEKRTEAEEEEEKWSGNARHKHSSTVSLPNYDELDTARHRSRDHEIENTTRPRRPVRSSTVSLPAESFLSPFSEKTSVRLEDYVPRSDNLSPYQVIEKLGRANGMVKEYEYVKYDSSKAEHWELSDVGYDSEIQDKTWDEEADAAHFSIGSREDERRRSPSINGGHVSPVRLEKPEAFGKTASPLVDRAEQLDPNRSHSRRYDDPPPVTANCCNKIIGESSPFQEPFFLDEAKHRSVLDTIEGAESRITTEEEEEEEEEEELRSTALIRTISEESLPREMLEEPDDDFFDEKLAKDARNNNMKKCLVDDWNGRSGGTPPPSPEPKIKPTVLDPDHSTLFKILKEEAAEESNVSSMTPSLTELEAALSDMLEKEDSLEGGNRPGKEEPIPKILEPVIEELRTDEARKKGDEKKQWTTDERKTGRKVSFCSWEESIADRPPVSPREDNFSTDPPRKPNRSNKSTEEDFSDLVPTPPRRKNKSGLGSRKESEMTGQNDHDRLI